MSIKISISQFVPSQTKGHHGTLALATTTDFSLDGDPKAAAMFAGAFVSTVMRSYMVNKVYKTLVVIKLHDRLIGRWLGVPDLDAARMFECFLYRCLTKNKMWHFAAGCHKLASAQGRPNKWLW